jgi:hypothetical protein
MGAGSEARSGEVDGPCFLARLRGLGLFWRVRPLLTRLRGLGLFWRVRPLLINGLFGKVFTTRGGWGWGRLRCAVVAVVAN